MHVWRDIVRVYRLCKGADIGDIGRCALRIGVKRATAGLL